ncbi:MAG: TIGR03905 family TSCPD domain-containing protein [Bacteroidales bacterium]|nr:TIGR03905 family TSCPD domain-containing protein [Candidatus Cacconaster merdequi]
MNEQRLLSDQTTPDGTRVIQIAPSGIVCAQWIGIAVKDDIILEAAFEGGCNGNSQGIARLVKGMNVRDVVERLEGISCAGKGTSCPDQLAKAIKTYFIK